MPFSHQTSPEGNIIFFHFKLQVKKAFCEKDELIVNKSIYWQYKGKG